MASSLSNLNICTPFSTTQNYKSCFVKRPITPIAPCNARAGEARKTLAYSQSQRQPQEQVHCGATTIPKAVPVGSCNRFPEATTIQQMMNTMNRLMGVPTTPCTNWASVPRKESDRYEGGRAPWAIKERKNEYKIRFDMPGMTRNDVKIWVEEGNMLVIKAEKAPSEGGNENDWWPSESFRMYNTRIALPENVDSKKIKAVVKDGAVYITIPKASSTSRINIDVQ